MRLNAQIWRQDELKPPKRLLTTAVRCPEGDRKRLDYATAEASAFARKCSEEIPCPNLRLLDSKAVGRMLVQLAICAADPQCVERAELA